MDTLIFSNEKPTLPKPEKIPWVDWGKIFGNIENQNDLMVMKDDLITMIKTIADQKIDLSKIKQELGTDPTAIISQEALTTIIQNLSLGFLKYQGQVYDVVNDVSDLADITGMITGSVAIVGNTAQSFTYNGTDWGSGSTIQVEIGYLWSTTIDGHGWYWFDEWNQLDFKIDMNNYYTKDEIDALLGYPIGSKYVQYPNDLGPAEMGLPGAWELWNARADLYRLSDDPPPSFTVYTEGANYAANDCVMYHLDGDDYRLYTAKAAITGAPEQLDPVLWDRLDQGTIVERRLVQAWTDNDYRGNSPRREVLRRGRRKQTALY
jgi:hypothetical protein